jgi:hypothetical protein
MNNLVINYESIKNELEVNWKLIRSELWMNYEWIINELVIIKRELVINKKWTKS